MSCAGSDEGAFSDLLDNCCASIAVTMPSTTAATNPFDSSSSDEDDGGAPATIAASPKKGLSSPPRSPDVSSSPMKKTAPSPKASPRKTNTNPFSSSEDEAGQANHDKSPQKVKKKKSKKKPKKKDSVNPFSSDEDEEKKGAAPPQLSKQEVAALDDELANLDLDADFLASSTSLPEPTGGEVQSAVPPAPQQEHSDEYWQERLERDEVFSHRYKPSAPEKKELQDLQVQLGGIVDGGGGSSAWGIFGTTSTTTTSASGVNAESQQAVKELFVAIENSFLTGIADMGGAASPSQPSSIILKRGNVKLGGAVTMEIILLTHGMLLIQLQEQTNMLGRKYVKRSLQQAVLWDAVSYCGPVSSSSDSWQLVPRKGAAWEFQCEHPVQQEAWLQAVERILVQHFMHQRSAATLELGWQYKIIHKAAFTLAVQGKDEDGLALPPPGVVNRLDEYNEFAPLHYAVRLDHCDAARRLLEHAGADVNVKDGEGHTPMYYALRDEVSKEMSTLLEKHGANKNNKERRAKEDLFGRVKATEETVAAKKQQREEEERQKAAAAQAQMAENMRLMNERGQKIEEIGDKARNLNDETQNYANMARQLKEKTRRGARGSKWLPF